MQKIKLKLVSSTPFWFMGDFRLDDANTEKIITLEDLTRPELETINRSLSRHNIKAFNSDGEELKELHVGGKVKTIDISTEDVFDKELEDSFDLEVISATVPLEEEVEEEPEEITEELLAEAVMFINKNANTVKRMIRTMPLDTSDIKLYLLAICEAEKNTRNRPGILKEAELKLSELTNG